MSDSHPDEAEEPNEPKSKLSPREQRWLEHERAQRFWSRLLIAHCILTVFTFGHVYVTQPGVDGEMSRFANALWQSFFWIVYWPMKTSIWAWSAVL